MDTCTRGLKRGSSNSAETIPTNQPTNQEAVLMCTHNQCFEQKKKNITLFYLKITIFTAVKYRSILHGRVIVMVFVCVCVCERERERDANPSIAIVKNYLSRNHMF